MGGLTPPCAVLTDSAVVVVDLLQVGLDDLYVVAIQHLATAMLNQIQDLEHYLVACFLTSRKLGAEGSGGHGVSPCVWYPSPLWVMTSPGIAPGWEL